MSNLFVPQAVHPSEHQGVQHLPATPSKKPQKMKTKDKDKGKGQASSKEGCSLLWSKFVKKFWKSSLLKLCYKDLVIFLLCYNAISLVYRYALNDWQVRMFEQYVTFFAKYTSMISMPFLLGFYLTIIAGRWWQQYLTIPWPDRTMMALSLYCTGSDDSAESRENAKLLRRVLMRRCLLMLVLLFRHISESVHNRFPELQDLVDFGLMSPAEKQYFDNIVADINLYWVPSQWFVSGLRDGVKDGSATHQEGVKLIMEEFLDFRAKCGLLWGYNWINIPRVYGQVVTLAAYSFFAACLVGRQCVDCKLVPGNDCKVINNICHIDVYFPVWTVMEFLFYMGLLKVAEQMENPFGDDDEDFDLNFLINRHVKTIRLAVDYLGDVYPPLDDETLPSPKQMNVTNDLNNDPTPSLTDPFSSNNLPRVKFTSSVTTRY